jgi:histidinol-phosphate/aromatic aminotransferase/cobyric acid decarboxylase-like protein
VLVRWWDADRIRDFARVTIGTDEEMDKFLNQTAVILSEAKNLSPQPSNDGDPSLRSG